MQESLVRSRSKRRDLLRVENTIAGIGWAGLFALEVGSEFSTNNFLNRTGSTRIASVCLSRETSYTGRKA